MASGETEEQRSVGSWLDLWEDLGDVHQKVALEDFLSTLRQPDWEQAGRTLWSRLGKALHFREQTVRAMSNEKLTARLIPNLRSAMTANLWSVLFYVYWRKHHSDLMNCFLGGLGIAHDEHGGYKGDFTPPTDEALDRAVQAVTARFSARDFVSYLRVLLVREPQNWKFLKQVYWDLCAKGGATGGSASAGTAVIPAVAPMLSPDFPSDEFTTLDKVLIKSVVETVSESEGSLDPDELGDLVSTVIGLNSSRYRTYFHLGFLDTMVPGRNLDFEQPEINDPRREWYLCGALTGLLRKRDSDSLKAVLSDRSGDFVRASARAGGPGAAMARTLISGLIEIGRIGEAALLIRGQVGESVGLSIAVSALRKASELLRDSDLVSAGALLIALDQVQHRFKGKNDAHENIFKRNLSRRLGQYHQAQGNFKQAASIFERLLKHADSHSVSDVVADLGLVRAGFKSLAEVKLPIARERRSLLRDALRRGRSQFDRAVSEEGSTAINAHYALAVLKYLERSQEHNNDQGAKLVDEAVYHAQAALDGMRLAEAAVAYERLGLTGQCLFIQAVLQMQRLDPVDARSAAAAWAQITPEAGMFPIEDLRELIQAAEIVDEDVAVHIAESVWKFRPHGAVELAEFDSVVPRSQFLRDRLTETARHASLPKPQRWALWSRLIPILLHAGDLDAAEEGLDTLQQMAEDEGLAKDFIEFLSEARNHDPVWDRRDVSWARIQFARRIGDDQLSGSILRSLFFEVRDSDPEQSSQILDLCVDWKLDGKYYQDLPQRIPSTRGESVTVDPDGRLRGGEVVRVLFVGGNEIQEQYDRDITELLRTEWPGVQVEFRHTGWSSNWGRVLDGLRRDANASDSVVLMTMMRTLLGRKLRAGLTKPWVTCAATGRQGMLNSIRRAARVGLKSRANSGRA